MPIAHTNDMLLSKSLLHVFQQCTWISWSSSIFFFMAKKLVIQIERQGQKLQEERKKESFIVSGVEWSKCLKVNAAWVNTQSDLLKWIFTKPKEKILSKGRTASSWMSIKLVPQVSKQLKRTEVLFSGIPLEPLLVVIVFPLLCYC